MKENLRGLSTPELTRSTVGPKLNEGVIFMASQPRSSEFAPSAETAAGIIVDLIGKSGEDRLAREIAKEEDNKMRLDKSAKELGRNLSDEEKQAIIRAHYIGTGEEGKDGNIAAIGNYTQEQIWEKARILKVFSKDERRILMENGLVGDAVKSLAAAEEIKKAYGEIFDIFRGVDPESGASKDAINIRRGIIEAQEPIYTHNLDIPDTDPSKPLTDEQKDLIKDIKLEELKFSILVGLYLKEETPNILMMSEIYSFVDVISVLRDAPKIRTYLEIISSKDETEAGDLETKRRIEANRRILFELVIDKFYSKLGEKEDEQFPPTPYPLLDFEIAIKDFAGRKVYGEEFTTYINKMISSKVNMHNWRQTFKEPEAYKSFLIQYLKTTSLDFVQNKISGVSDVISLYEKILMQKVAERKSLLRVEDVIAVDKEVKDVFDKLNKLGKIGQGRSLFEWEIKRALEMGKTLLTGTQRLPLYVSIGDLPEEGDASGTMSIPYEYIARSLLSFKLSGSRYFRSGAAGRFYESVFKTWQKIEGNKNKKGLFGISAQTEYTNGHLAYDMQSHSWRSNLIFLKNIMWGEEGNPKKTLYGFIEDKKENEFKKINNENISEKDKEKKKDDEISEKVLGQRLYLTVLANHRNLSKDLKIEIWKKMAILKPSTIIALAPSITDYIEKSTLEKLLQKLYIAEMLRFKKDSENFEKTTEDDLKNEYNTFKKLSEEISNGEALDSTSEEYKYQILDFFTSENGIKLEDYEKLMLREIIDRAFKGKEIEEIVKSKSQFIFALDDCPKVSWSKDATDGSGLEDSDMIRLIANDQKEIAEGYAKLSVLYLKPEMTLDEVKKSIQEIVNQLSRVGGFEGAQKSILPYIVARLNYGSTDFAAEWIPGVYGFKRMFNKPVSEKERDFGQGNAMHEALSPEDKRNFIYALAAVKAINSEADIKGGITSLEKIIHMTESGKLIIVLHMAIMFLQIFPATFVLEFMNAISPIQGGGH
ncbi:hypothetical protein LBMAG33_5730 [Candidatus Levyibacteriota bacterium]|nr:hypothetical protein LBMAG33_5730 [Candidatus Levybacteria bacterium]